MESSKSNWIGAIDQGTTSTRFFVFDGLGKVVASAQKPITLISPTPGWVEQSPTEIVSTVKACMDEVYQQIREKYKCEPREWVKAIGIANQRETTIAWNARTGEALNPAIVWMDTRNHSEMASLSASPSAFKIKKLSGLLPSTYFSAGKIKWMMENVSAVREAIKSKELLFGHPHVTDVTNAHRTCLLNLGDLKWSKDLLDCFGLGSDTHFGDFSPLPKVSPSVSNFGSLRDTLFKGTLVTAVLGDQHAALLGSGCTDRGKVKNTYGTGCFMLCNVGASPILTDDGLLSTIAYQLGKDQAPFYALEAPIASAGSSFEWLKNKLEILSDSKMIVFVPALSGLLAPQWNSKASGAFLGLSHNVGKGEMIKAVIDAIAFSGRQVLDLIKKHVKVDRVIVDGGLTNSQVMMQTQADAFGIPVIRPALKEATVFGAAKAAAMGIGLTEWPDHQNFDDDEFYPKPANDALYADWLSAVQLIYKFSQKDHEVLRKAAEAGKQGKMLPEYDEKGQLINPYIPMYISKAPWYMKTGDEASLQHQKITEKVTDSDAHHLRGFVSTESAKKFRKNACENCGAITHKTKDCLERPRKRGARWTGKDIKPDEFIQEAALGFEGKRDRWAGYEAEEYTEVIQDWERAEAERKAVAKDNGENSSSESSGDDELYAEAVDMPGQKVDLKTRMTVRNLRLREDTAKYLQDLSSTSAKYDPKTRSMKGPEDDSFVSEQNDQGSSSFAWERQSLAAPDRVESAEESKVVKKKRIDPSLEDRYGPVPKESDKSVEESDKYVEYDEMGKIKKQLNKSRE